MKTQVNRRSGSYHRIALELKSDLDLIASILLALSYSRRAAPTWQSQALIQMDCVAICFVDGSLWIASNSQRITKEDTETFRDFLQNRNIDIWLVANGTPGKMHAEMQLLSQLIEEKISTINLTFGVSKPCCKYCKEWLDKFRIGYTMYHCASVVNWESPI